ncbi:MAG: hypothetical protein ACD_76C00008G0001, partial [uncultured bacterium]
GRAAAIIVFALGSFALPALFALQARLGGLDLNFDAVSAIRRATVAIIPKVFFGTQFNPILDFVYGFGWNSSLIYSALAVCGVAVILRNKIQNYALIPATFALMLIVNYIFLSSTINFSFLIDYERTNYADRALQIAIIFVVPYIGISLAYAREKLENRPKIISFALVVFVSLIVSANTRLAYPRHDQYAISRGFNVSQSDIAAVKYIDSIAEKIGKPYIVLANQSVSAAAVRELGFKKYYGNIFYYPIPTGGALYEQYLKMVNELPLRETAREAMNIVGADKAYFVVNDYWWQSGKIIENAKIEADEWISLENGRIFVFTYDR